MSSCVQVCLPTVARHVAMATLVKVFASAVDAKVNGKDMRSGMVFSCVVRAHADAMKTTLASPSMGSGVLARSLLKTTTFTPAFFALALAHTVC